MLFNAGITKFNQHLSGPVFFCLNYRRISYHFFFTFYNLKFLSERTYRYGLVTFTRLMANGLLSKQCVLVDGPIAAFELKHCLVKIRGGFTEINERLCY